MHGIKESVKKQSHIFISYMELALEDEGALRRLEPEMGAQDTAVLWGSQNQSRGWEGSAAMLDNAHGERESFWRFRPWERFVSSVARHKEREREREREQSCLNSKVIVQNWKESYFYFYSLRQESKNYWVEIPTQIVELVFLFLF